MKQAKNAAYAFMTAIAANLPGFEEASHALFAGDRTKLIDEINTWASDVRDYALQLAEAAFIEQSGCLEKQ